MGLISAVVKTVGVAINDSLYKRDIKNAQTKAYRKTCKDSKGFNPNWKATYERNLTTNQQNAKQRKTLRSVFINELTK